GQGDGSDDFCQIMTLWLIIEVELINSIYFFFQAEDGIRDRNVTGVQTCALPIFASARAPERLRQVVQRDPPVHPVAVSVLPDGEIGRATCRERVKIWVDAVTRKRKSYTIK